MFLKDLATENLYHIQLEEGAALELQPRVPCPIRRSMSYESQFEALEELGKGSFGVVKRCRCKETGDYFAAKFVRKTAKSKKEVTREIQMMNQLHHKRLVQIRDAFETDRQMIIVMELISGEELFEKVVKEDFKLTEMQAVRYLRQILYGVQHMHKKNIVHLDLKPENILCLQGGVPGYEEIKLIDFGLARELKAGQQESAICGTPEFVAPEVINFDPITIASDTWALGVITYVLLSGISPFLGDDDAETLQNVTTGEYDFEDEDGSFENVSGEANVFIQSLIVFNPKKRMTVDQCLDHKWLQEGGAQNVLDTTNLKRFIARRRWQRTITAIKAVGRFTAGLNLFKNKSGSNGLGKNLIQSIKEQQAKEAKQEEEEQRKKNEQKNSLTKSEDILNTPQEENIRENESQSGGDEKEIKADILEKQKSNNIQEEEQETSIFEDDKDISDALKRRAEKRREEREELRLNDDENNGVVIVNGPNNDVVSVNDSNTSQEINNNHESLKENVTKENTKNIQKRKKTDIIEKAIVDHVISTPCKNEMKSNGVKIQENVDNSDKSSYSADDQVTKSTATVITEDKREGRKQREEKKVAKEETKHVDENKNTILYKHSVDSDQNAKNITQPELNKNKTKIEQRLAKTNIKNNTTHGHNTKNTKNNKSESTSIHMDKTTNDLKHQSKLKNGKFINRNAFETYQKVNKLPSTPETRSSSSGNNLRSSLRKIPNEENVQKPYTPTLRRASEGFSLRSSLRKVNAKVDENGNEVTTLRRFSKPSQLNIKRQKRVTSGSVKDRIAAFQEK